MKNICALLIVSLAAILSAPVSSPAQSGQIQTRKGRIPAHAPVRGPILKTAPEREPERDIDHPRLDPPIDPTARPADIRPTNPETVVRGIAGGPAQIAPQQPSGVRAPDTLTFFRNTQLSSGPMVGGKTLGGTIPIEPSGAINGRTLFFTTNNYGAVSGDGGKTFTYIDPAAFFPSVNGGFNGDQVIYYERTRGLMFWFLQYNTDNNTNTQRLAVAQGQANLLNNTWGYYDFTPADYGFRTPPAGASGFWLDFPDLSVSDNFLYITTNVFPRVLPNGTNPCAGTCPTQPCPAACRGVCTSVCTATGSVISRIALNELAQGRGINFTYASDTTSGFRCTHGAHATMYWGAHRTTGQIRIYRWAENSATVFFDDINHSAYNTGTQTAASPDGNNFAAISDSRILGAYVANGVLGFMWNAAQGGGFPYPHVQWLRFNENNRSLLTQWQIYNNNHAFLYPSVHPNDRGHLGGTMAWGGGIYYPSALAWIADDFDQGAIPFDNLTFATGNAGPNYNRWGDYFSTRVNVPYGNTWLGTGFVVNGAGGVTPDPRYVWFGRERDTPPATNAIYVNLTNSSAYEDGTTLHPYNTVNKGHFAAQPGDTIIIRTGNYPESVRFSTASSVRTDGGPVIIGRP